MAMRINKISLAPQILEAAEAEVPRDDALRARAFALFNLAHTISLGLENWKYNEVETLLEQGEEALKACKSWFPPLFRKLLLSQLAEPAEGYLAAVRRKYPRDYRTQTLGRDVSRAATEQVVTASVNKTNAVAEMAIA